jgi:threonine dehydrogenase-like Zn-dependent dehydrogenase
MKQVFIKGNQIVVEETPSPSISDDRILVANACSLISTGTEGAALRGQGRPQGIVERVVRHPSLILKAGNKVLHEGFKETMQQVRQVPPGLRPLGYSTAGAAISIGRNVGDISTGDRVAGQFAHHAEIISVPPNLTVKIPSDVSYEQACFSTVGAVAMHGVRRTGIQLGETVALVGLGLLGLISVQIAKAAGYKVIGFDTDERRCRLAVELGADSAFTLGSCDPVKETETRTSGFGADAVVICAATDSNDPVNLAFDLCRQKARVVVVGAVGLGLDRGKMYQKELDLLMSTSYGPGRYDSFYEERSIDYPISYVRWTENRNMMEFLNLLAEKKIDISPLIDGIYPVDQAEKAYSVLRQPGPAPAILLKYNFEQYTSKGEPASLLSIGSAKTTPVQGKISTGIIGAGGFVQRYRLPCLKKLGEYYDIRAVSTQHGERCKALGKEYEADYVTTNYHDILEDGQIDLVMIGTRHNLHYPIIIDALRAGKKVFTEKPLCLRMEELESIVAAVEETGIPVFVGFNRRHSPLMLMLKNCLSELSPPYLLQYRVNAGHIPPDHWTQDPETGGGRIIGEACHFLETFHFLVGKEKELTGLESRAMYTHLTT